MSDNYLNIERTGTDDAEFNKWCDEIQNSGLSDAEISLRIRDKLAESPELDAHSRALFLDTYEYVAKILKQNKKLETNLLKIYLRDLKGYDVDECSVVGALVLVSMCGLGFSK